MRRLLILAVLSGSFLPLANAGCSSTTTPATPAAADAGAEAEAAAPGGNFEPEVACKDSADSLYGDPGALPAEKGAILRCVKDKDIPKADLEAKAKASNGYVGKAFTSGAKVYRVLYRTERGDDKNTPGYSVAQVFVPDTPRDKKLPIVVASRGSRGQAAKCAPSKGDPAGDYVQPDFDHQVLPLVGAGYVVIAPDLAGYANYGAKDNPPSAYADVKDVGKSTLDGARALRRLLKTSLLDKVVLVGHSQGGGSALGALALAESYAFDIPIVAVATYSPLWRPGRTNQGFLFNAGNYDLNKGAIPKVSVWYTYTKGELRDGPGGGLAPFKADKQAGIKKFVDESCWAASYPDFEKLGTTLKDLYDDKFLNEVGVLGDCNGSALCEKWTARFVADRPPLSGAAQKVPILDMYGEKDESIIPTFARCIFDKFKKDGANYKVCVAPGAGHSDIVSKKAEYVNDWIAAKALGAAAPTVGCEADETTLKDAAGKPVECDVIINLFNQ